MKLFLVASLFLISIESFSQSDYELFQQYSDKSKNIKSSKIIGFEVQEQNDEVWRRIGFQKFNSEGMPLIIYQNNNYEEWDKKVFTYDSLGQILKIESYKSGNLQDSTNFVIDKFGRIVTLIFSKHGWSDGKYVIRKKTEIEYYPNNALKKITETKGLNFDTTKIDFYDTLGVQVKSLWFNKELRTVKLEFKWNEDKTVLRELHFQNDTSVYYEVVSKFKNGKIIEKLDPAIHATKLFYWKYDSLGRVIETNSNVYYTVNYTYDQNDNILSKTIKNIDSSYGDKKTFYKYQYTYRN